MSERYDTSWEPTLEECELALAALAGPRPQKVEFLPGGSSRSSMPLFPGRGVSIHATADCYLAVGDRAVAAGPNDFSVAAGTVVFYEPSEPSYVAVRGVRGRGTLYIEPP